MVTDEQYRELLAKVRKYAGDDAEDILHDAILTALTHQCVDFEQYVLRCSWHEFKSKDRRQFCNLDGVDIPEEQHEEVVADVFEALDATGCSWWEKEYFKRKVLEGKTNAEMSDDIGITVSKCEYSFTKVKRKLKEVLKNGR